VVCRIMRDRALYKVNCDFVEAATKGAKAVISRCIPPINPTDPDRFHMCVPNLFLWFSVRGCYFTQMG
jgi:protein TIF31